MRIAGEWRVCDDGVTRPALRGKVQAAAGAYHVDVFLVDSCADRTVFSENLVILSRRRNEVLLLAPNHEYRVELIGIGG